MPSNQTTFFDEALEADDWIELYNPTSSSVDLGGYFISDKRDDPLKHMLPSALVIDASGVLLLWADGTPEQGDSHLPFRLASSGEVVVLSGPNGEILDSIEFPSPAGEESFARFPDGEGEFAWCSRPTPDAPNGLACESEP